MSEEEKEEKYTPLEVKVIKEDEKIVNDDIDYEDFDITDEDLEEIGK